MSTGSTTVDTNSIAVDLTWMDLLRGIAIIGVIFDNWTGYMELKTTPAVLYSLARLFALAVGPFVQVFFILSGFGLTVAYLHSRADWSWKRWAWRRTTKIVIPYVIVVILSFVLGIVGSWLYPPLDMQFSGKSLLAYLTFTRNFYAPSWAWNPPLWFMPVIIGLYASFPVLIKVLERWGPWVLLLVSALVTYGTITIADLAGVAGSHGADLFSFWMLQFSLGILLAYVRDSCPRKMNKLIGLRAFCLGSGIFAFSWGLRTYLPAARVYNDVFTTIGIFLVLLNLCWTSRLLIPVTGKVLCALSSRSYFIYLIHYPIMAFLIGPPIRVPTNAIVVIILGGVYIACMFLVSHFISQPINKLTSWLYQKYSSS